jgi:hypothetical protein
MTYKIKVHNPWLLAVILLSSILIPIVLLNKFGEGVSLIVSVASMFGAMTLAYYFSGRIINVELSENGISTTWAAAPFFTYCDELIAWGDILWWNFQSGKMVDVFSIKTRTGQTLYIRCLDLYSRQRQLSSFMEAFRNKIDNLNKQAISPDSKIVTAPSIYEKPIGKVFAVLIFIALIFLTYSIQTQGLGSKPIYKIVFVYIGGTFWIGMTITFYFVRRKKRQN